MAAVLDGQRVIMLAEGELADLVERAARRALELALAERPADASSHLLARRELARALGVSLPTVDRRVGEGMPSHAVGSCRRFDLAEVRTWLATRRPDR